MPLLDELRDALEQDHGFEGVKVVPVREYIWTDAEGEEWTFQRHDDVGDGEWGAVYVRDPILGVGVLQLRWPFVLEVFEAMSPGDLADLIAPDIRRGLRDFLDSYERENRIA